MSPAPRKAPAIEDPSAGPWLRRAPTTLHSLFRHPVTFWDDVYRGEGLVAPMALTYVFVVLGVALFMLLAKAGIDATHKAAGAYSGMLLVNFYSSFPAQILVFILTPLFEPFIFGGVVSGVLSLFAAGDGTFRHTSRLSSYSYLAIQPFFILFIGLSVYMSANPIGTLNFFGAGDVFASPSAAGTSQVFALLAMLAFIAPGVTLRALNILAIKKTLGTRVTWTGSVVSGIAGTLAMMIVVFLVGLFCTSLTVRWITSLDRNKPLSKVESILLAPTRREPLEGPRPTDILETMASQTGLNQRIVVALLALDPALDLKDKWVHQFTLKMLKRYTKAYLEIDRIYAESGIPTPSHLRIPPLERILRENRTGWTQNVQAAIPDQLSKTNMISSNCEKNLGAACAGILRVIGEQKPGTYCRHEGWEKMNEESMGWADHLKAANPGPSEVECLKKVRSVIDKLLEMEFNYTTNSRDYPDHEND